MQYLRARADFSVNEKYRYRLERVWDEKLPPMYFMMLNPSTADAKNDDPTIRKCVGFAKRMTRGSIVVVNLFALRSTQPSGLLQVEDPIGPSSRNYVAQVMDQVSPENPLVVAWGEPTGKALRTLVVERSRSVLFPSDPLQCLGKTKSGQPRHPLMLPYSTPLEPWELPYV